MRNFLKKHSRGLFVWFFIFVIFAMVFLIVAFENRDKKLNNINKNDDTILYENAVNNLFDNSWFYASAEFGYWEASSEDIENGVIGSSHQVVSDDLMNNSSYIDNNNLSYAYFMQLVNAELSTNGLNYVDKMPYFTIRFNGGVINYSNLLCFVVSCPYSATLYVDIMTSNGLTMWNNLVYDSNSNNRYINSTNSLYTNSTVSWIRFRNGSSLDFTNSNSFEPFQAYFGTGLSFISDYNVISDARYNALQAQYSALYKDYNELLEKYNSLSANNSQLQTNIDTLQDEFNTLNSNYETLNSNYNDLEQNYNTLSTSYNILLEQYNTLQNQSDFSFSELIWSITAVPFNFIASGFNVDILGVNIASIITGLFTAAVIIWLFKKLFK